MDRCHFLFWHCFAVESVFVWQRSTQSRRMGPAAGGSLFRRMDFTSTFAGFRGFIAYDLQATTWHSAAEGANAPFTIQGETTEYKHNARRVLPRGNMANQGGKLIYVYHCGYQSGLAVGATWARFF